MDGKRLSSAVAAVACTLALAGCASSGSGGGHAEGTFGLAVLDDLAGGRLDLKGTFLHGKDGWVAAHGNGTSLAFAAKGTNVSLDAKVPAGDYDGVRILFAGMRSGDRAAVLAQSGIELDLNISVPADGRADLRLAFAWADSLFESAKGLAFEPSLSRIVVAVDGKETQRLEAAAIHSAGQVPVARMRIFDPTGLEAFQSTFVAESPEKPVIANAGLLTLSATGSEVLVPGATIKGYAWDIDGKPFTGATVQYDEPIDGGNLTVRLTVTDSAGGSDAQTVHLAVKPGRAARDYNFTGSATGFTISGPAASGAQTHPFGPVKAKELDGAPARLVHLTAVLVPGASPLPVADLDLKVLDGAGATVGSATGAGSQHRIDQDITGEPADGDWSVVVTPQRGYQAEYTVLVTLSWQGVNPGMEAFLATYDDGHTHQH
ncbi:MAG: hypothetical protein QOJ26_945 [Thermoplasmata archaeon]|jgi:hypothetical protein|nr:hypothetical protein [Thermoplasmata archaeon]MEA3166076.1 hypothetical protein [Thermoplasmata archaeon]